MKQDNAYKNQDQMVTCVEIHQHKKYHYQGKNACNVESQPL